MGGSFFKKDKKRWRMRTFGNTVHKYGLREAAPPEFPPSYKLAERRKQQKDPKWGRCFKEDLKCFFNPSGSDDKDSEGKHNPAWTDRILLRSPNDAIQFETNLYSRVASPKYF